MERLTDEQMARLASEFHVSGVHFEFGDELGDSIVGDTSWPYRRCLLVAQAFFGAQSAPGGDGFVVEGPLGTLGPRTFVTAFQLLIFGAAACSAVAATSGVAMQWLIDPWAAWVKESPRPQPVLWIEGGGKAGRLYDRDAWVRQNAARFERDDDTNLQDVMEMGHGDVVVLEDGRLIGYPL